MTDPAGEPAEIACHCGERFKFSEPPRAGDKLVCEACGCISTFNGEKFEPSDDDDIIAKAKRLIGTLGPSTGPLGALLRGETENVPEGARLGFISADQYGGFLREAFDAYEQVRKILNLLDTSQVAGGMLGALLIRQCMRTTGIQPELFFGMIKSTKKGMVPEDFAFEVDHAGKMAKGGSS
jgi:hypothetical protein